jgi:enterochelin esterase family protein
MRIPIGIIACWICCSSYALQYHGTLLYAWYNDWPMTIYLPEDYFSSTEHYPVLYLLHGMGGDESCWLQHGDAKGIFDKLIANGEMCEMVIVMPFSSGLVDGSYEQSFDKLMSYVESNFRIHNNKQSHAIAGFSLGGFYSMHISHHYHDKFDYIGLFSAIYTADKKTIFMKQPNALFGVTSLSPDVYRNTEQQLVKQFRLPPKLYFIAIGKHDFLYNQNVLYREFLVQKGYPFIYYESPGGHGWKNWQLYLKIFLPLLFK